MNSVMTVTLWTLAAQTHASQAASASGKHAVAEPAACAPGDLQVMTGEGAEAAEDGEPETPGTATATATQDADGRWSLHLDLSRIVLPSKEEVGAPTPPPAGRWWAGQLHAGVCSCVQLHARSTWHPHHHPGHDLERLQMLVDTRGVH